MFLRGLVARGRAAGVVVIDAAESTLPVSTMVAVLLTVVIGHPQARDGAIRCQIAIGRYGSLLDQGGVVPATLRDERASGPAGDGRLTGGRH
jgi:hypothetical protein